MRRRKGRGEGGGGSGRDKYVREVVLNVANAHEKGQKKVLMATSTLLGVVKWESISHSCLQTNWERVLHRLCVVSKIHIATDHEKIDQGGGEGEELGPVEEIPVDS